MTSLNNNVLVVGPYTGAGGVVTFQRNLIEISDLKSRWNFTQYNIVRPPQKKESNHHYNAILQQDFSRFIKASAITAKNFLRYFHALKSIDVVQIQSSDYYSFWESAYYALVAKKYKKPVVVRYGGVFDVFYNNSSPRAQKVIRWFLQQPDAIIVQSQSWKDFFSTLLPAHKIHIVGNAIPFQPPIDRSNREELPKVLFICGAEAKRKGYFELIEAVKELPLELIIVAPNEDVRKDMDNRNYNHVTLLEAVPRDIMKSKLYPQADIFVIPSHGEGFPNSMLEAMAASLPIIATPVGAIPEVIQHEEQGFIVPVNNVKELRARLKQLATSKKLQQQMGKQSYQTAMEKYEINTMFARFERVWSMVIQNKHS